MSDLGPIESDSSSVIHLPINQFIVPVGIYQFAERLVAGESVRDMAVTGLRTSGLYPWAVGDPLDMKVFPDDLRIDILIHACVGRFEKTYKGPIRYIPSGGSAMAFYTAPKARFFY